MAVKPYLQLVRIHNVIGSAISALMGYLVSSHWHIIPLKVIIAMLVVAFVATGGYVINDVYDVEIDRINKPYRPIPSGAISLNRARNLSYITSLVGIALSALLGLAQFLVALVTVILLFLYASSLKRSGLVGNLIVALTSALSAFYGGLAYFSGDWLYWVSIPTLYIFFFTLVREFIKGIEDYEGDKENYVKTLAVRIGISKTWKISKTILLILVITSPLPYLLGFNILYLISILLLDILLVYILLLKEDIQSSAKARSLMKVYAIGTMLAFIIGSFSLIL
ncbi:UbiA family prenyltransferase [Stygiolobus caldivivus]|uniref:Digeranylgeranylglyceryl phosphate synthase n=1 Tax=Stygiolobus caldivivus TaxID=2824673 RepID=A0A8D5U9X2_9CREN|nr:UbiA family prenyltransferase [Stygiolobus caldivivus]BCU71349.1 MFS transporter [Stygiolobus caldivivus]